MPFWWFISVWEVLFIVLGKKKLIQDSRKRLLTKTIRNTDRITDFKGLFQFHFRFNSTHADFACIYKHPKTSFERAFLCTLICNCNGTCLLLICSNVPKYCSFYQLVIHPQREILRWVMNHNYDVINSKIRRAGGSLESFQKDVRRLVLLDFRIFLLSSSWFRPWLY